MVAFTLCLLVIFFPIAIYFKKKNIFVKGMLSSLVVFSVLLTTGILFSPVMKHFYNIIEHDIIKYEILPLAHVTALPKTLIKNVTFSKSGMYEVVLVKAECFRDIDTVYSSNIKLRKEGNLIQNLSFDRHNHQVGEKKCKFPYSKSYVLGFFNIPFSFNDAIYDVVIDIETSDKISPNDMIVIRQSMYM